MSPAVLGDRALFPDLRARSYLNHAAISPPSAPVRKAVAAACDVYAREGVAALETVLPQRDRVRARLASLVGARPEDIGFVPNTTAGVVDVALCLPWRAGDRVILFEGEFPANVTPWQRAAELFGLELSWLPLSAFERSHEEGLAALDARLADGVRLVAVSAVQFRTGLRMPLSAMAERCHARGAELFVDGIQACGAAPLDVVETGIDYLSCGGHKWLMGLEGVGFLYVAPSRVATLRPVVAGWLGHEDALSFLTRGPGHLRYDRPLRRRADVVEQGAQNVVGIAALEASVGLLAELGVEAIGRHVEAFLDPVERGLVRRGFRSHRAVEPAARSAILSVTPPDDVGVTGLWRALGRRGVACSIPDGLLRFAPHWPNALDEVGFVLDAVDEAIGELRSRPG